MKIIELGELMYPAEIERRGNRAISILSMSRNEGLMLQSENSRSAKTNNPEMHKVVRKGQLVTGIHMDEGSVYVLKNIEEGCVSPAYGIWDINVTVILPEYLELVLHSDYSLEYFRTTYVGTTKRRGKVPTDLLLELKVPLPEIEAQRKIVNMIEKIVKLKFVIGGISKLLSQADKSIYYTIVDKDAYEVLTDISRVSIGQSTGVGGLMTDGEDNFEVIPFYQGKTDFGEIHPKNDVQYVNSSRVANKGDLLMTVREPTGELNIVRAKCGYGRGLAAISPIKGKSNTAYLYTSLSHIRKELPRGDGILSSLSMKHMDAIELPRMSIIKQEEFSKCFEIIISLRGKMIEMCTKIETLNDALYENYFNRLQFAE